MRMSDWSSDVGSSDLIFIRPHEPGLIGQHGKAGCATRLIGAGMGRRVEILPYQSLERASFLHFRDQPIASFGMGTIKRCLESARRRCLSRLRLKRCKRDLRLEDGAVLSIVGNDLEIGVDRKSTRLNSRP